MNIFEIIIAFAITYFIYNQLKKHQPQPPADMYGYDTTIQDCVLQSGGQFSTKQVCFEDKCNSINLPSLQTCPGNSGGKCGFEPDDNKCKYVPNLKQCSEISQKNCKLGSRVCTINSKTGACDNLSDVSQNFLQLRDVQPNDDTSILGSACSYWNSTLAKDYPNGYEHKSGTCLCGSTKCGSPTQHITQGEDIGYHPSNIYDNLQNAFNQCKSDTNCSAITTWNNYYCGMCSGDPYPREDPNIPKNNVGGPNKGSVGVMNFYSNKVLLKSSPTENNNIMYLKIASPS